MFTQYTPAAVDYIMFNFGEFLSISNIVWRAFIKESGKKDELLVMNRSKK
jgi:hypothetical protein